MDKWFLNIKSYLCNSPKLLITMKKLIFLIVAVFCLASCKSLPERIEIFVSDVEANYENYTELDWAEKDQKMAEFKLEYAKKADKLSQYERDYINKAFGRYDAVVTIATVGETVSGLKEMFKDAGRYIEGLVEGMSNAEADSTENNDEI